MLLVVLVPFVVVVPLPVVVLLPVAVLLSRLPRGTDVTVGERNERRIKSNNPNVLRLPIGLFPEPESVDERNRSLKENYAGALLAL